MLVFGRNVLKEVDTKRVRKVYLANTVKDKSVLAYLKEKKLKYEIVSNDFLNEMTKLNHQGVVIDIYDY